MTEMIQKLIKNKTIYAVASIVIGIFMIIRRGAAAKDVLHVIGWLLIGTAAVYLVSYFMGKDRDNVQLGYAAGAGIGGLLLVLLAGSIVHLAPILAGALLIVCGITNLTGVNTESDIPKYSRGTAIAIIVLGALVIVFGKALISLAVLLIGICLILNGLAELDIIRRFW